MIGRTSASECPAQDELARFQRGETSGGRCEQLIEHLERCGACQSSLASLSVAPDDLLTELRQVGQVDWPDEPSLAGEMASLESESVTIFVDTQRSSSTDVVTPSLPLRWGEYALLEAIGRGGMGTVYRAKHTRLEKVVAIKLLAPQRLGDPGAVERFEGEMKAIGQLNHPNIVSATDAGEVDGAPFLVMEFVDGIDLARLVKRHGPLGVAEACELVRQAAVGLEYAHARGLVHRDMKPSNLLLAPAPDEPSGGLVKIADLGLALLHDPRSDVGQAGSRDLVIGSLDYMAPEQASNARQVDKRADLYSLGCTLYELLAGKPPFASPGQSRRQKLQCHASDAAPSLIGVRAGLPASLDQLLRKLLAKDPADRLRTAAELATALEPFAARANLDRFFDSSASSTPRTRVSRGPRLPPRHRWTRGLVGGLIALVMASVIYVETDRGTLEIRSDDDEVAVRVEQDGKLITLVDLKSDKKIRLRSGTYQVALGDADQDLSLDADEFTLRRGDKEVVRIRRQSPNVLRAGFDASEAKRSQLRWAKFRRVPVTLKSESGVMLTLIPPGEFEMRSGYQVKITKPYYLGIYEITVDQFRRFADSAGYRSGLEEDGRGIFDLETVKEVLGFNWRSPELAPSDDYPVAGVTWSDAERFCAWLSKHERQKYRLPTEAEWEWAVRCGRMTHYASGDEMDKADDDEWRKSNSAGHAHPVGQKPANAWGLYDTGGNLAEWCFDWSKDPYPQGTVSDPFGPAISTGTRTLKGGSFVDSPLPFFGRGSFGPDQSMSHLGFRVCREL